MARLPFPRPFTAAFHRTPCVLLNSHRITRARSPSLALRSTESLPVQPFSSFSFDPLTLTSAVGSPPSSSLFEFRWRLERRHIYLLNLTACSVAISTAWLFFSAIPALLAFQEAADSLEKLLNAAAEELPDAMAAVRLSGMEITDLTTELCDLGEEITDVVRSSTRVIRTAEDRLHYFTTMAPTVSMQVRDDQSNKRDSPLVAKTAKNMREGIAKGRIVFGVLIGVMKFSRWALNFFGDRRKKKPSV